MTIRKLILALAAFLVAGSVQAQLQTAIWFFGQQAGLDFRGPQPIALTNGQLVADEGCSSQADSAGNLLFYANGTTIWNRNHQVIMNGSGLLGNSSSSQQLIVPQPGSSFLYYVFTPPEYQSPNGLTYSLVDMRRQTGLGEVMRKNVPVLTFSTERITAVLHANRRDVWIIAHERDTNRFCVYLLTSSGLNLTPIISLDGFVHENVRAIGQLKSSPDGRRLALTAPSFNAQQPLASPGLEVLDFDAASGRITNPVIVPTARLSNYGVEFSPDGTLLYVSDSGAAELIQYDLQAASLGTSAVRIPMPAPSGVSYTRGALQLAPDGRIYIARPQATFLSVITAPNQRGAACGYVDNGISLSGQLCRLGLPSFLPQALWHFQVVGQCQNNPIVFAFAGTYRPDSVQWDFGDTPYAFSHLRSPTHTYRQAGRYLVSLTLYYTGAPATVLRQYLTIAPKPLVYLGRDTAICPGSRLTLNATTTGATYRWQDNSMGATLAATRPGVYWVDVTSEAGCTTRDSLRVYMAPEPRIQLWADTVMCVGQTLTLHPRLAEPGIRYRWSDNSTTTLTVSRPGTYWLEGTNAAGCRQRDSLRVYYLTPPTIYLGRDTALCQNAETPYVLDATLPGVRYRWSDGTTNATLIPPRSGTYWVTVSTPFCSATDSIRVQLYDCRQALFVPNIITPNGDGQNDALKIIGLAPDAWSLRIYNRWGKEVYQSPAYQQDWQAAGLADGVYYYWLRASATGQQVKGWVEVLR